MAVIRERVIVKFAPGADRKAILSGHNTVQTIDQLRVHVISVAPESAEQVRSALARRPGVEYAEYDYAGTVDYVPSDPDWVHIAAEQNVMNVEAAWDISRSSANTVIAVVDSGVDGDHPDLVNKIHPGARSWVPNTATALTESDPLQDINRHGTNCAAIAAAESDNGSLIPGFGFHSKFVPLKVTNEAGSALWTDVAAAITYATDLGVDVITLSISGDVGGQILIDAGKYALSRGTVVCASAGNNNNDVPRYPASYPEYLSVTGCVLPNKTIAIDYAWGNTVDIAANYQADTVDVNNTTATIRFYGTSASTPQVAGIVSLIKDYRPNLLPHQIVNILKSTSIPLADAATKPIDGGLINAGGALAHIRDNLPSAPGLVAGVTRSSGATKQVTISWAAVTGATSYVVKRYASGSSVGEILTYSATGTSFTDPSTVAGSTYSVSALNDGGHGPESMAYTHRPIYYRSAGKLSRVTEKYRFGGTLITPAGLEPTNLLSAASSNFEGGTGNWAGSNAILSVDTTWAGTLPDSTSSLRVAPNSTSDDSAAQLNVALPFTAGVQYTFSGTVRVPADMTGQIHSRGPGLYIYAFSVGEVFMRVAPRTAGVYELSGTFTWPSGATGQEVRLYHGGTSTAGQYTQFDNIKIY